MDLTEMELTTILEEQFGPDRVQYRIQCGRCRQAAVDLVAGCETILEEKFRPDGYTIGF